jgi:hypothetical protein
MANAIAPETVPLVCTQMKTIKTIRIPLACLCMAGWWAISLASCGRDRPERTAQRENQPGSTVRPGDRYVTEDAEAAREKARFAKTMRETANTFSQEMQGLKAAVAGLPAPRQEEGAQLVAELEQMLAAFEAQIAGMEKVEGTQWAGYLKAVLDSSLNVKGHLNRAAERVAPAEVEAGSQ